VSLLLDALKRAEQAKRAKAALEPESGRAADSKADVNINIESSGTTANASAALTATPAAASPNISSASSSASSSAASPAPTRAIEQRASPNTAASSAASAPTSRLNSTKTHAAANVTHTPTKTRSTIGERLALVNDSDVSPDITNDTASAALRKTASANTASAKATANVELAKTVFNAKHSLASDTRSKPWLAPLIALSIVLLGLAVWYAWQQMSQSMLQPPSTPAIAAAAATSPTSNVSSNAPLSAASQNTGQPGAKALNAATVNVANAPPPMLMPLASNALKAVAPNATSADVNAPSTEMSRRDSLAQKFRPSRDDANAPVRLSVASSTSAATLNADVTSGYAALTRGDLAAAASAYTRAAQAEPYNVDAYLGLATAAAHANDSTTAIKHYRRVLELDPRNSTALAGLLAINPGRAPNLEVDLKTMLAKDANSPSLQFALGNFYASENRWTEAQQVFFEAYRLDSNNADFMFNLAISLDHLNQSRIALDYYQKAVLQAAKSGGAQFDRTIAQRRITELQNSPQTTSPTTSKVE
jgi:tetratricopeptide (TPR) repeat protein